jgi:hypothetical protein
MDLPFSLPNGLVIVRRRDIMLNAACFSIAIEALTLLTTNKDAKAWQSEIVKAATEKINKYTDEEIFQLFEEARAAGNEMN